MKLLPSKKIIINSVKVFSVFVLAFSMLWVSIPQVTVALTLEEELAKVKKDLESIRNSKKTLEGDIKKEEQLQNQYDQELVNLKNQVNLLSNKIQEKRLVIKELELEIEILTAKLDETGKEILTAEGELFELETETNYRLVDIYLSQKTFSELNLIVSPKGQSDIIKFNLYQNSIQDNTNNMVGNLKEKRIQLELKKQSLVEDKIKVQRDEVQLKEELLTLERDEADLSNKRSTYFSRKQQSLARVESNSIKIEVLTDEEKEALAQLRKLEQILFNSYSAIPNGSPVKQGTIIGQQGCTGHCTGPHTHFAVSYNGVTGNPCSYLPNGTVAGCGIANSSLRWPQNMPFYITGWYENRSYGFHAAIDLANPISNAPVYAAHDGYIIYGVDSCKPYISYPCNPPGAKYALICENKNCNIGFKTMYLHLR